MRDTQRAEKCLLAPQMRYSKRAGFSAFELVCIIVIVAVIAGVGVRYLGYVAHKQCLLHLKAQLAHTQNALSAYYTESFIREDVINPTYAQNILHHLSLNAKSQCGFNVQGAQLIAVIGTQSVVFSIDPPNLVLNPKIFCKLSEPLCKELSDRILDK